MLSMVMWLGSLLPRPKASSGSPVAARTSMEGLIELCPVKPGAIRTLAPPKMRSQRCPSGHLRIGSEPMSCRTSR